MWISLFKQAADEKTNKPSTSTAGHHSKKRSATEADHNEPESKRAATSSKSSSGVQRVCPILINISTCEYSVHRKSIHILYTKKCSFALIFAISAT